MNNLEFKEKRKIWYRHDDLPTHYISIVQKLVKWKFQNKWNAPVLVFREYIKQIVYRTPVENMIELQEERIINVCTKIKYNIKKGEEPVPKEIREMYFN